MQHRIFILLLVLFLCSLNLLSQEDWLVPDNNKSKLSPFEFTKEINTAGADIYFTNCKSCHGDPGKNNFVPLVPAPGDPASDEFQTNVDGELYHKIKTGRGVMPSFRNSLNPNEVWSVICYIRSYNANYKQVVAKEIKRSSYDGEVTIEILYVEEKNLVKVQVIGENNNNTEPIVGAGVQLFAERLFGKLKIGEAKFTDKDGIVKFSEMADIPGDTNGNIKLIARLSNQEVFGQIVAEAFLPVGIPTNEPSLVAERAMWNKMSKAPLWVLLSYTIAVLAAWGTIFFVLFQLKKIFSIGKEINN